MTKTKIPCNITYTEDSYDTLGDHGERIVLAILNLKNGEALDYIENFIINSFVESYPYAVDIVTAIEIEITDVSNYYEPELKYTFSAEATYKTKLGMDFAMDDFVGWWYKDKRAFDDTTNNMLSCVRPDAEDYDVFKKTWAYFNK